MAVGPLKVSGRVCGKRGGWVAQCIFGFQYNKYIILKKKAKLLHTILYQDA